MHASLPEVGDTEVQGRSAEQTSERRPGAWSVANARALFRTGLLGTGPGEYLVDEDTWRSLDGDRVFARVDRCLSFAGSQYLYRRLRSPLLDAQELEELEAGLAHLSENKRLCDALASEIETLASVEGWGIAGFLAGPRPKIPFPRWLLGTLVLLSLGSWVAAIVWGGWVWSLVFLSFALNCWVHFKSGVCAATGVSSLMALRRMVRACARIEALEGLDALKVQPTLRASLSRIDGFAKGGVLLDFNDWGGLLEYVKILGLFEARFYAARLQSVEQELEAFVSLLKTLGYLDHCLSILRLRQESPDDLSVPLHREGGRLRFEEGVHPLLESKGAVKNGIEMQKPGVVLTGLNMGGKSTFLKSVALHVLLSQTIHTVFCRSYQGPIAKVLAVMEIEDDLEKGRSHFMQELLAVQRLVSEAQGDVPCFLVVDEMFRGTNSDERVAASSAVLRYLGQRAYLLVATHDLELLDLLGDAFDLYYFSGALREGGGLCFDYKLREGRCPDRNAIELMRWLGYPKEVVDDAAALCD